MMRSPLLWFAALASLVGGIFYVSCERGVEEVSDPARGEAARDSYLAARRMLDAMGAPVTRLYYLDQRMPSTDATLIMPDERSGLTSDRAEQLLDWVGRGGHLVVVVWTLWDAPQRTP